MPSRWPAVALAGGHSTYEPWLSDLDAPLRDHDHARTHAALALRS